MKIPDVLGKRATNTFGPAVDLRGDKRPGAARAAGGRMKRPRETLGRSKDRAESEKV
jgi:hypothetical protein